MCRKTRCPTAFKFYSIEQIEAAFGGTVRTADDEDDEKPKRRARDDDEEAKPRRKPAADDDDSGAALNPQAKG